MDQDEAVQHLEDALGKVRSLRSSRAHTPEHVEFVQTTGLELVHIFGPDSAVSKNFSRVDYQSTGNFVAGAFDLEQELARRRHEAYLRGLDIAEGILLSARNLLESLGAQQLLRESRIRAGEGRVFISHGTQSAALTKTERFVRTLGLQPIVVIREPSEGLSVDQLVDKRMSESDCVLVLATADEETAGRRQPRPNVIHEIGLAQEKHGNRIIYLKEEGCEFPSNVRPKVWESFTQENMEAAFEKIIKELRAFGLL